MRLLVAVALLVVVSYLLYLPYDEWWFLRFVLTALVCGFVLASGPIARALERLAPRPRAVVLAFGLAVVLGWQIAFAVAKGVFALRDGEHRYLDVARAVEVLTPANAVVFPIQHSGSVRFYARRLTFRPDQIGEGWLEPALAELERRGHRPYFLLEDWEEPQFKRLFASRSALGRLDWAPLAEYHGPVRVRLYDPRQRGSHHRPIPILRTATYDCRRLF